MAPIASLTYPKKSHRKSVTLPPPSVELAEFFGIMMGDGGINNAWQANITLNSEADAAYIPYVSHLCTSLFGITPHVWSRKNEKATIITLSSITVVDFLVTKGLVRGNKIKGGMEIPTWVLLEPNYRKACVRGLMDTDGCLYIHKHKVAGKQYRNLGLCFSSFAPAVISQTAAIFEEFGIIPHISNRGRNIYLYSRKAVMRYLEVFGTSNERISSVLEK